MHFRAFPVVKILSLQSCRPLDPEAQGNIAPPAPSWRSWPKKIQISIQKTQKNLKKSVNQVKLC